MSLRILQGGCSGSRALYEEQVRRSESASAPPVLAPGDYGFEAQAFDASGVLLASVCESRALPSRGPVRLLLASASGACSSDEGGLVGHEDAGTTRSDAGSSTGCGDRDQDGCDDCSYTSRPNTAGDGPETDGDGRCDCVVFADASIVGAGDGKSWSTAFSRLQDAVDSAEQRGESCEVWVRQGTYHSYRTAASDGLLLRRSIDMYGGFTGGELLRAQRSGDAALTIIDGRSAASAAQRVSHVLTGASDLTIDSFTILGGDAAGAGDAGKGGGMINVDVALTLRNVRFLVNHAGLGGGAIYNQRANIVIERSAFEGNSSDGSGGAILDESGTLAVRASLFRDNQAKDLQFGGGAIYERAGIVTIENALFAKNSAARWGGAILGESATTSLTNCTVTSNAADDGAGLMGINGSVFSLKNSIFYDNAQVSLRAVSGATFDASFCDIQGGFAGTANIDLDPKFVGAASGDYHLAAGSPCLDAANGNVAPAFDLEGRPRADSAAPNTGTGMPSYVDIGAYELTP